MAKRIKNFDPVQIETLDLHTEGYGTTDDEKIVVLGALSDEVVIAEPYVQGKRREEQRDSLRKLLEEQQVTLALAAYPKLALCQS